MKDQPCDHALLEPPLAGGYIKCEICDYTLSPVEAAKLLHSRSTEFNDFRNKLDNFFADHVHNLRRDFANSPLFGETRFALGLWHSDLSPGD